MIKAQPLKALMVAPLNEVFKRHARSYLAGDVLFFIDGSGGMPDIFGRDVQPGAVVCTLQSAAELAARDHIKSRAVFWTDNSPAREVDLQETPEQWMRRFPNGQTLILPSLRRLQQEYSAAQPLHIIIVSDGMISDDREQVTQNILQLCGRKNVFLDCIITCTGGLGLGTPSTPLQDAVNITVFDLPDKPPSVHRVHRPQDLQDAIHGFINARMAPEALAGAINEAALQGTARPLAAMAPIRWKK